MKRRRYLVTYDICNEKRLHKVFKNMNNYGDRLQYSVFLCELNEREKIEMKMELTKIINTSEDQIVIIDLGLASRNTDAFLSTLGRDYIVPSRVLVI